MNTNKVFMAFAKGNESTEGKSVKRYKGVAPVFIIGINPNKAELGKIYNTEIENDPVYISETEVGPEGSKYKVPQIRLDFIVRTDIEKCNGIDLISKVTFFLSKEVKYNRDRTKVQVINKYGEFTWVSIEDAKNNRVSESVKWFDPTGMRPAFIGEEELTGFIKAYLVIPNKSYKNPKTGETINIKNVADAEAQLDNVENYFKGDISELKTIIALQPNNKVKVLFGERNTDDGKKYQTVYTNMFLKNSITDYSYLDKHVQERKANGAYPNTDFEVCDLKESVVESTDFNNMDSTLSSAASPWFN